MQVISVNSNYLPTWMHKVINCKCKYGKMVDCCHCMQRMPSVGSQAVFVLAASQDTRTFMKFVKRSTGLSFRFGWIKLLSLSSSSHRSCSGLVKTGPQIPKELLQNKLNIQKSRNDQTDSTWYLPPRWTLLVKGNRTLTSSTFIPEDLLMTSIWRRHGVTWTDVM